MLKMHLIGGNYQTEAECGARDQSAGLGSSEQSVLRRSETLGAGLFRKGPKRHDDLVRRLRF